MKCIKPAMLLLLSAVVLAGCGKSDDAPYVIFRDAEGQVLSPGTRVMVELNSVHTVYSDAGYERFGGNNLDYDWKVGDGVFEQYSVFDGLRITTLGRHNNLAVERASFTVTFSEDMVAPGALVVIRVEDQGTLSGRLTFEVR